MKDNRNELKSLCFESIAAHLIRMSREGNVHLFAMFGEGSNFANPTCPMHRRSLASREDSHLNYEEGSDFFSPLVIAEICAASLLNNDVKDFKEIIAKDARPLSNNNDGNQGDRLFFHERALREICE